MANQIHITVDRLKQVLHYDPTTGTFTRLESPRGTSIGRETGFVHKHCGYRYIGIDKRQYFAHKLAWLYFYGEWPRDCVDHIDRNKLNNSIKNLRLVTQAENNRNKSHSSGKFVGCSFNKERGKWAAQICLDGKNYHLGYFKCETAAHLSYLKAKPIYHKINTY